MSSTSAALSNSNAWDLYFIHHHGHATKIQSLWRGFKVRRSSVGKAVAHARATAPGAPVWSTYWDNLLEERGISATKIQSLWRGYKVRETLPRLRAEYYAKYAGEGLGHKTIAIGFRDRPQEYPLCRVSMDWLNKRHGVWAKDGPYRHGSQSFKVTFGEKTETLYHEGPEREQRVGWTNFAPRGDSPSWTFSKVINAHYGNKGVWKCIKDDMEENLKVDQIFQETIEKLESGEMAVLWDGSSTKIRPTFGHISKIKAAYVKFRFFAGLSQEETPKSLDISDLEARLEKLKKMPPAPKEPMLPRTQSVRVNGMAGIFPVEKRIDDLEERMLRLLNMSPDVIMAEPVSCTTSPI